VLLFVALILALAVRPAGAADPDVVDMTIDQPDTVTVGDHVRYTVVVEVDQGTNVALAPSALPQEVELIDTPVVSRKPAADGREQITLTFEIAPFVPGQVSIPPLPVRYTAPDGTSGVLQTQSSLILVQSVLDPNNLALRDLKPQAAYGTAPAGWIVPALIGCVVAVIVLIAAAIWRRSVLRQRAAYVPPPRPVAVGPEDLARDALDKAGIAFREDGDFDAYYTALGNAVRNYLTGRYEFPAFALTTRELEAEMLGRGLDRWQVRVAGGLLSQCDSVVYARYRPATERADADLTAAYEIVEMSRPEERMREEAPVA
jgi:hypothetical protein